MTFPHHPVAPQPASPSLLASPCSAYPLGKSPPGGASQTDFSILQGTATVSGNSSFPDLAGIPLLVLPVDAQDEPASSALSVPLCSLFLDWLALTGGSQASEPDSLQELKELTPTPPHPRQDPVYPCTLIWPLLP